MFRISPHLRFLGCHDCGTLVPLEGHEPDDRDDYADDLAAVVDDFLGAHRSHRLAELYRTTTDALIDRPFWDPLATLHLELTDGERTYVARAHRRSVEEPREYAFVTGCLQAADPEVGVDERDVRRGLDLEFFPHAVRPTKVDDFLSALHAALRDVEACQLEIAFIDAEDPEVSIARMPEQTFQQLLSASSEIFDAWEVPLVERFLRENRGEDGVLALRVRRHAALLND